ncbi:MAG: GHKL domain-containing protein, partial [Methanobacteriota archaeon]
AQLADNFNLTVQQLKRAREVEEKLLQEKLERADRLVTLGEVAAEIAHEVNNPASIILTRAELIRDELNHTPQCKEIAEDVNIIIQQTERIASCTRSILHYARKYPREFRAVDLTKIIQQSLKIYEPSFQKKGVQIHFHTPEQPVRIKGNPQQLEQVFCNLLQNSLDVVPANKGKVDIKLQVRPSDNAHNLIQVEVSDNGPGIPEELREKVFSPFFTTKPDGKGTGLGLFIVRKLIQEHKGKIYLSSNGSKGAKFILEFRGGL